MVSCIVAPDSFAVDRQAMYEACYDKYYTIGYERGYEIGARERACGLDYEPKFVTERKPFKKKRKELRERICVTGTERMFNRVFKQGWQAGFTDGYFGRAKEACGGSFSAN